VAKLIIRDFYVKKRLKSSLSINYSISTIHFFLKYIYIINNYECHGSGKHTKILLCNKAASTWVEEHYLALLTRHALTGESSKLMQSVF
jgi:hypothetical protein